MMYNPWERPSWRSRTDAPTSAAVLYGSDEPDERPRGNPKGNPQNLVPGRRKSGALQRDYTRRQLEACRESTMDKLGVAVDTVLKSTGASVRSISRATGRELNRIIPSVLAGNDCHLSTLLDLATVCGYEVDIRFTRKTP